MVPTTPDANDTNLPNGQETPPVVPDEPDEPDEPDRPSQGGPSAGEVARARSLLANGSSALDRNDIEAAIGALSQAQRAVGRRHSSLRRLRDALARKGSNKVGILMQQGNCPQAQALYRRLRSVGASSSSSVHFSPDWCPRP
jgi:hypothetical protein